MREFQEMEYEQFAGNYLYTDTAEHNLQIAIQATLDIGSIIRADQQVMVPERYTGIFPAPAEIEVLPEHIARKLVNTASFRNLLVHRYMDVDLTRVYRYVRDELEEFETFAHYVSGWLLRHAADAQAA